MMGTLGPLVRDVSRALHAVMGCEKTYVAQFAELGDVLLRGKKQLITNADSLGNMAAIDAVYAKAGVEREFA